MNKAVTLLDELENCWCAESQVHWIDDVLFCYFLSISHYIRLQIITVAQLFITALAMQSVGFLCQSNLTSSIFYSPAFSVCSENVGEYLPLQNLLQTATVRFSRNGTLFTRWCFRGGNVDYGWLRM